MKQTTSDATYQIYNNAFWCVNQASAYPGFWVWHNAFCHKVGNSINDMFLTDDQVTFIINSTTFLKINRICLVRNPNPPTGFFRVDIY